jgi:hypothetical protein
LWGREGSNGGDGGWGFNKMSFEGFVGEIEVGTLLKHDMHYVTLGNNFDFNERASYSG